MKRASLSVVPPSPQPGAALLPGATRVLQDLESAADKLQSLCAAFSSANDNRVAITLCAERILEQAAVLSNLSGDDPAVIESRQQLQEYRMRLSGGFYHVQIHARSILSAEEGTKPILRRFRLALASIAAGLQKFGEYQDNRGEIIEAVAKVQPILDELLILDNGLSWVAGNVSKALVGLNAILHMQVPTAATAAVADFSVDSQRLNIASALDDLLPFLSMGVRVKLSGAREDAPAVLDHSPITPTDVRFAVFSALWQMRGQVAAGSAAQILDAPRLLETLQAVRSAAQLVAQNKQIREYPIAAIEAGCNKVAALLGSAPAPAQRSLIPAVNDRQTRSLSGVGAAVWGD